MKCPVHNCTAEYICKTKRLLKERISDHRNQTTSAIKNYHISKNSYQIPLHNRNIGKVRIPHSIQQTSQTSHTTRIATQFNPPTQGGHLLYLVIQYKRQLALHTFLISIYNRKVIPVFTPFKLQNNSIFRSPPSKKNSLHTSQSGIFSKLYSSFMFSSLLISSSNKAEGGTS